MKAVMQYPELIGDGEISWENGKDCVDLFKKIMPGALLGCTGRGFAGSGYDDVRGLFDTLTIFSEGQVEEFLSKYPDMCPKFTELYRKSVAMIREHVESGEWKDGWGDDFLPDAKKILCTVSR